MDFSDQEQMQTLVEYLETMHQMNKHSEFVISNLRRYIQAKMRQGELSTGRERYRGVDGSGVLKEIGNVRVDNPEVTFDEQEFSEWEGLGKCSQFKLAEAERNDMGRSSLELKKDNQGNELGIKGLSQENTITFGSDGSRQDMQVPLNIEETY